MSAQMACAVLGVSASGYYAWKSREASPRQRRDMVLLAHIRSQFSTSNETYGSPRMRVELNEDGLAVGRHRVARIMRDNDLKARQKTRFKKSTDSDHHAGKACLRHDAALLPSTFSIKTSQQMRPTKNGASTSCTFGRRKFGSIWRSAWTCSRAKSSAGR